jgi:hypothetical protein
MTASMRVSILSAVLAAGCDAGGPAPAFVIPGPTVPSPLPTTAPYVWDSEEELSIWMNNSVTRGSLALVSDGAAAFIRIDRADREWVLRGPDLTPAVGAVRTLRIRYRWRPDPALSASAARTARLTTYFQTPGPVVSYDPIAQAAAIIELQPADDWTDVAFIPGQYKPPIEITYCYLHSLGANRGVIEIDRLELVR